MEMTEYYRIGELLISLSSSLFAKNSNLQGHLSPFRLISEEERSKCTLESADLRILDRRDFGGSFFSWYSAALKAGTLIFEEEECAHPTKMYRMQDASYIIEFNAPDKKLEIVFQISGDWSELSLLYEDCQDNEVLLFQMLGSLFAVGVLYQNACVFHGVVMDYEGKGILVMAESGVGKSTHTNRWESMGLADIINGDRCLCRKIGGKWYAYGMPWAGSSGKHLQKRVPVSWILDLKRGPKNRIEELSPFEKEIFLLQRIYSPVTPGEQQDSAFEFVHELAEQAVVKRFFCLPDEESVLLLKAQVDEESRI